MDIIGPFNSRSQIFTLRRRRAHKGRRGGGGGGACEGA